MKKNKKKADKQDYKVIYTPSVGHQATLNIYFKSVEILHAP